MVSFNNIVIKLFHFPTLFPFYVCTIGANELILLSRDIKWLVLFTMQNASGFSIDFI